MTAELPRIPDALRDYPARTAVIWRWLDDADEPLTRGDLAYYTGLTDSQIDKALGNLDTEGLLARTTAPGEGCRRRYRVE